MCTQEAVVFKYPSKYIFLQIWQNPHENMCCSLFNTVKLQHATVLKTRLQHWQFFVNFAKFLWTFFTEHFQVQLTASCTLTLFSTKYIVLKQTMKIFVQQQFKAYDFKFYREFHVICSYQNSCFCIFLRKFQEFAGVSHDFLMLF